MFIEDEWKRIYLNYKIKEIIPFSVKLTPKQKKETAVILKKFSKKDCGYGDISMLNARTGNNTHTECLIMESGHHFPEKNSFTNPVILGFYIGLKLNASFEAIIHKIIPDNFDTEAVEIILRQKIKFVILPVKRFKRRIYNSIIMNISCNRALKKLVLSILSAKNQPVFNFKKTAGIL